MRFRIPFAAIIMAAWLAFLPMKDFSVAGGIETGGFIHLRYGWTDQDTVWPNFGLGDDVPFGEGFWVRRFRAWMRGKFDRNELYVQFQADKNGKAPDLHVADLSFSLGGQAKLHLGQFQTPAEKVIAFSCNRVLLVDRPRMSEMMGLDKDIGAMVELLETGRRPSIKFGLFNGNGKAASRGHKPMMKTARIEKKFGPLTAGAYGFVNENVSVSAYLSKTLSANSDPYKFKTLYGRGTVDERGWGTDCWYARSRFDLRTGYSAMKVEDSMSVLTAIEAGGYYVETGFFFGKRNQGLQAVAGYQKFDPNRSVFDRFDLKSYTVGLNWHVRGLDEVARVNYEFREPGSCADRHGRLVLQYQLIF